METSPFDNVQCCAKDGGINTNKKKDCSLTLSILIQLIFLFKMND